MASAAVMSAWMPADWIRLVEVVFYGIAIICLPLATAYITVGAARAKRAEESSLKNAKSIETVSTNVDRLEKNTNSISERNQAIAQKLGITEGIAQERASVLANAIVMDASTALPAGLIGKDPLPVTDDQMARVGERIAAATEESARAAVDSADAAGRVADAAEEASASKPRKS